MAALQAAAYIRPWMLKYGTAVSGQRHLRNRAPGPLPCVFTVRSLNEIGFAEVVLTQHTLTRDFRLAETIHRLGFRSINGDITSKADPDLLVDAQHWIGVAVVLIGVAVRVNLGLRP